MGVSKKGKRKIMIDGNEHFRERVLVVCRGGGRGRTGGPYIGG